MRTHTFAVPVAALFATTFAAAQSHVDRAFTATGASCDQVQWSEEALEQYPNIASACQEVMERNGKYYVKFNGTVRSVQDRGRKLTVDFKGGDQLTLTPPENLSLTINGRPTSVRELERGDLLTFYVPQDQLSVHFSEESAVAQTDQAEMAPAAAPQRTRVAQAEPEEDYELPATAGFLPLIGLGGLALTGLALLLTVRRKVTS